jgi:GT2 family glycosyltransferase
MAAVARLPQEPPPTAARPTPLPSASVLVVTFESRATIVPCLEALFRSDYPSFEVVVVDNGSADDSADVVRQRFPAAKVIRLPENRGFAGGVLAASELATGEILVLLNPDTVVDADWLAELVGGLLSDDRIGLAGSKILEPDGRTIQHMGGRFLANALSWHIGRGEPDDGRWSEPIEADYVTGAALAVRRTTLDRHGFLDPGYFPAYYEEAELAVRLRKAGLRVVCFPRARLTHLEAASTGKSTSRFHEIFHRNRLRFVLRTHGPVDLLFRFLPAEARWVARSLPAGSGRPLAAAWAFNLLRLPAILASRLTTPPFPPARRPRG